MRPVPARIAMSHTAIEETLPWHPARGASGSLLSGSTITARARAAGLQIDRFMTL